jgi:hypothetical protein
VGNKKFAKCPPQCIIGITNPFLLRTFAKLRNAIFVPADASDARSGNSGSSGKRVSADPPAAGLTALAQKIFPMSLFGSPVSKVVDSPDASPSKPSSSPEREHVTYGYSTSRLPPPVYRRRYVARATHLDGATASLESAHDDWLSSGGAGDPRGRSGSHSGSAAGRRHSRKMGYVNLIYRDVPTAVPDRQIQTNLSQFSSGDAARSPSGIDEESDAVLLGGSLLREHFKTLTLTLLRPFESFFSPIDPKSRLQKKDSWSDMVCGPAGGSAVWQQQRGLPVDLKGRMNSAAPLESPPASLSVRRAGAGALWLYADATTMLGTPDPSEAIKSYLSAQQSDALPFSFAHAKAKFTEIALLFYLSSHFKLWCEWRRNRLVTQLCWSTIETSKNLSMEQLLYAFAVELNTEVLTVAQLNILADRIEKAMANARAINAFSSCPVSDDRILCAHMEEHLLGVKKLIAFNQNRSMYDLCTEDCV